MQKNIMYFELTAFYKRDVYFVYDEEQNELSNKIFNQGEEISVSKPLLFSVDKIDSYINNYDILPTYNAPLVSKRLKNNFEDLENDKQIQFINVTISDQKGNINNDYYLLNVLKVVPCMDMEKSIYDIKTYGKTAVIQIKKLYIISNGLKNYDIIRMKEKKAYIIVTKEFTKRCEVAKLKGLDFVPEGYSIYTDI
ncbi:imm11 family protein [Gilliamella sp. ESL0441]|uniref:imm11 family protein n=1 Tax=Gilliamella sp. ESL0441 TaxID=2704654 RepID=UPI001C6A8367|nr:DUF1629 domain-containing protein [Gilliamella sp. ESL0441]